MNAIAAPEPMTVSGSGLELGGKAVVAAAPEKKRPSKIASSRTAADLDDSADEEQQQQQPSSSSYPADPTLETCCHEPPPIALNPLNSFLFAGEKVLRLPIPPTNDIVVSSFCRFFFGEFALPEEKKGTHACRRKRRLATVSYSSVPVEKTYTMS